MKYLIFFILKPVILWKAVIVSLLNVIFCFDPFRKRVWKMRGWVCCQSRHPGGSQSKPSPRLPTNHNTSVTVFFLITASVTPVIFSYIYRYTNQSHIFEYKISLMRYRNVFINHFSKYKKCIDYLEVENDILWEFLKTNLYTPNKQSYVHRENAVSDY